MKGNAIAIYYTEAIKSCLKTILCFLKKIGMTMVVSFCKTLFEFLKRRIGTPVQQIWPIWEKLNDGSIVTLLTFL